MKRLLVFVAAMSALFGGVSHAAGGNSEAAKACQKGGWQTLVRSDGTAFKNTGDCVSYAAHGGTFGEPEPPPPSCLDGNGEAFDALLTGPIDSIDNLTFYTSTDGTCSGSVDFQEVVVSAGDQTEAGNKCSAIVGFVTTAGHLSVFYPTAPADWWHCVD